MKLSIAIITYNHEKYIKSAIDGILMQEVDFCYEIVVGEDASEDKTRKILLAYKEKYPDKFNLILHDNNVGMMQNFIQTLNRCNGEYIAILEGDDYWTDSNKLQKQADFLDANPDFVMTATAYAQADEETGEITEQKNLFPFDVIKINDLLENNYVSTLTCMFRNRLFESFPEGFVYLKVGDWPLHILNARYGKIKYFGDWISGIYRIHKTGVWSKEKRLKKYLAYAEVFEFLKKNTDLKYRRKIKAKIVEYYYSAVTELYKTASYKEAEPYIKKIKKLRGLFSKEILKLNLKKILK